MTGVRGAASATRLVSDLVDRLIRVVPILAPSRRMVEMVARFAGVGGLSSLIYAVVVGLCISIGKIQHDLATLIGFAVATPINFVLHRTFTFHSRDMVRADLVRYLLTQALALLVSLAAMSLCVDLLRLPPAAGIAGAIVLVPIATFLVMNRWVFALKAI